MIATIRKSVAFAAPKFGPWVNRKPSSQQVKAAQPKKQGFLEAWQLMLERQAEVVLRSFGE